MIIHYQFPGMYNSTITAGFQLTYSRVGAGLTLTRKTTIIGFYYIGCDDAHRSVS